MRKKHQLQPTFSVTQPPSRAEQAGPGYAVVRDHLVTPLQDITVRLVAVALGRREADEHVKLCAAMIMGQVSAFNIHRKATLQTLGWPDFEPPRRAHVHAALRRQIRAVLHTECSPK